MEKLGGKDLPRGRGVDREIYEVSSKLDSQRRLFKSVNLAKLPDKGARMKKQIDELEGLLKTLNLKFESAENDKKSVCLDENDNSSSCGKIIHEYDSNNDTASRKDNAEKNAALLKEEKSSQSTSSFTGTDKQLASTKNREVDGKSAEENDHGAVSSSQDFLQTSSSLKKNDEPTSKCNTGAIPKHNKQSVASRKISAVSSNEYTKSMFNESNKNDSSSFDCINSCSREKNENSHKLNPGAVSKPKEQTFEVRNKSDTKPAFRHRFEAELASFDQLSKAAPISENSLKDLVDSPSFKNWRDSKQVSGVKLTEAKPLFESFPVYKCKSKYTSNIPVPLASEEIVKKLHHSLCTYPGDAVKMPPPKSLVTPLLKHQTKGLSWLIWRETQQPSGGILADDMGLGKTLTMISLILKQKEENNYFSENSDDSTCGTLIVCLASIVHQWKEEITKHCEDDALTILLYHGPKRDRDIDEMKRYNVVLTTYNILLSERKSFMKEGRPTGLFLLKWERVILDEAHTIKNYKSQTAEAVFSLKSCRRWCVTGTPIHNEFKDMYSLVKFLKFSPFDDEKKWKKLINDETESSDKRRDLLVKSILLRRAKEDVDKSGKPLIKMVKKSIIVCSIELSEAEQVLYDELDSKIKVILSKILDKGSNKLNTSNTLLVLLLRLQQCCCHISLLGKEADDETFSNDSMQDLSLNLSSLNIKDKSDVPSSSSEESTLDLSLSEYLSNDLCDPHLKSTKLQKLYEMIDRIAKKSNNNDKSVIVSQWVSLLDIVATHLQQVGIEHHMIAGSTKAEDRQKMSKDFNYNNDGCKVMLLSLKAGGVGLNLIGGNHMFLLDLHWNPALEKQACDRIHRVGQTKDVSIYKFICKDTIEQRILALQKKKSELADIVLHGAGKVSKGLSMEDFKSLFNVRL